MGTCRFFKLGYVMPRSLLKLLLLVRGADIKRANQHHRNDQLNRSVQSMLFKAVADADEALARKALAVLVKLWRQHTWRDARTVSVIGALPQRLVACYARAASCLLRWPVHLCNLCGEVQ